MAIEAAAVGVLLGGGRGEPPQAKTAAQETAKAGLETHRQG